MVLTEATALSRELEAPPPRDMETILGRPVEACRLMTKFKPETLEFHNIQSFELTHEK